MNQDELKDLRVLVVEDEGDTREMVTFILAQSGAAVVGAGSVAEGLEVFDEFEPNVIVADIGMPGYNGYALIARIRAQDEEHGTFAPAIALTAYTSHADRMQALEAGFQEYMAKPFRPEKLVSSIARLARATGPAKTSHPAA